jgi:hypothetical protein
MSEKKRPTCRRCKTGWLVPEYEPFKFSNDSIKCINCGERIYKDYKLHAPTQKDKLQGALNVWE